MNKNLTVIESGEFDKLDQINTNFEQDEVVQSEFTINE